jgi:DNA-binding NarL/FixJ family response regulator
MSTGVSQIRILAVDDHPIVSQGIADVVGIQPDITVVGEAPNGREAIQQFRMHHPALKRTTLQNKMNKLNISRAEYSG